MSRKRKDPPTDEQTTPQMPKRLRADIGAPRKRAESSLGEALSAAVTNPHMVPNTPAQVVGFDDNEELQTVRDLPAAGSRDKTVVLQRSRPQEPEKKDKVKKQLLPEFNVARAEEKDEKLPVTIYLDECEMCGVRVPARGYDGCMGGYTVQELDHFAECEGLDLVPANQLAADWTFCDPQALCGPLPTTPECASCHGHTSTVWDLRCLEQDGKDPGDGPRPLQPCAPDCPTHQALLKAEYAAAQRIPGLKQCFCPVHHRLDATLARVSESPHAEWLGYRFSCDCLEVLKGCWCGECLHFQAQKANWFVSRDPRDHHFPPGWTSWLFVKPCPVEHVFEGYRD